jgi:hypothetical protein
LIKILPFELKAIDDRRMKQGRREATELTPNPLQTEAEPVHARQISRDEAMLAADAASSDQQLFVKTRPTPRSLIGLSLSGRLHAGLAYQSSGSSRGLSSQLAPILEPARKIPTGFRI